MGGMHMEPHEHVAVAGSSRQAVSPFKTTANPH
jgi:hypothetical protein